MKPLNISSLLTISFGLARAWQNDNDRKLFFVCPHNQSIHCIKVRSHDVSGMIAFYYRVKAESRPGSRKLIKTMKTNLALYRAPSQYNLLTSSLRRFYPLDDPL